jgi:hypothetical protein
MIVRYPKANKPCVTAYSCIETYHLVGGIYSDAYKPEEFNDNSSFFEHLLCYILC